MTKEKGEKQTNKEDLEKNKEPTAKDIVAGKDPDAVVTSKKNLSKAKKNQLKKQGNHAPVAAVAPTSPLSTTFTTTVCSSVNGYRNPGHNIGCNRNVALANTNARCQDNALRPFTNTSGMGAKQPNHCLEGVVLDLVGNKHNDLVM